MTLLYGGLFLVAGAILLGITYAVVSNNVGNATGQGQFVIAGPKATISPPALPPPAGAVQVHVRPRGSAGGVNLRAYRGKVTKTLQKITAKDRAELRSLQTRATAVLKRQRSTELDSLLSTSGVALGIMALISIGLGWLIAGRALRPVRTMSARARGISERNLHERLALDGPNDELKELGDTFDELLARLESAFESQRRFVANASHELRTPITLERTLIEVALADPQASVDSLRETCSRILAVGVQQERLIEALLTLARSQRGLEVREALDLRSITDNLIAGLDRNGVVLERDLQAAGTTGDPRLVERLVANLLDNALKYNQEHGWVRARTGIRDGRPTLEVANSGPVIDADQVKVLAEPFRRLNGDRAGTPEQVGRRGLGLGLSIVAAIAEAHGAGMQATARESGGLTVEVRFPPRPGLSLH